MEYDYKKTKGILKEFATQESDAEGNKIYSGFADDIGRPVKPFGDAEKTDCGCNGLTCSDCGEIGHGWCLERQMETLTPRQQIRLRCLEIAIGYLDDDSSYDEVILCTDKFADYLMTGKSGILSNGDQK